MAPLAVPFFLEFSSGGSGLLESAAGDSGQNKGMGMKQSITKWMATGAVCGVLMVGSLALAHAESGQGLGVCEGINLKLLFHKNRARTINDSMESWIGSDLRKIVSKWGAPQSTFDNRDGSRIVSWNTDGCTQSFQADEKDVLRLWSVSGDCTCVYSNNPMDIPKDTPVPPMTL